MSLKQIIFPITLLLLVSSCKKEESTTEMPDMNNMTGSTIEVSFIGKVQDVNGPVIGALVNLGSENSITDNNGVFSFDQVQVNQEKAIFKVSRTGYWQSHKTVVPLVDKVNNVAITLLEQSSLGNFSASQGGSVGSGTGLQVLFGANSIANSDGTLYDGTVVLQGDDINLFADEELEGAPGDFRANNSEDQEGVLMAYSMVGVELENELQIAEGSSATISFPISSALLSSAPSEIPLWYFDENDGVWKEEGMAVLVGDKYEGEVSHFSWWSCGQFAGGVYTWICVSETSGLSMNDVYLSLTVDYSEGIFFNSWLLPDGGCLGRFLPENYDVNISLGGCVGSGTFFSEDFGPISESNNEFNISIDLTNNSDFTEIQGVLTECDGTVLGNTLYMINDYDNITIGMTNADGGFVNTLLCSSGNITFFTNNNGTYQENSSINLNLGVVNNLGNIDVCELDEYVLMHVVNPTRSYMYSIPDGINTTVYSADVEFEDSCLHVGTGIHSNWYPLPDGPGMYDGLCQYTEFSASFIQGWNSWSGLSITDNYNLVDISMNVIEYPSGPGTVFKAIWTGTAISDSPWEEEDGLEYEFTITQRHIMQ